MITRKQKLEILEEITYYCEMLSNIVAEIESIRETDPDLFSEAAKALIALVRLEEALHTRVKNPKYSLALKNISEKYAEVFKNLADN